MPPRNPWKHHTVTLSQRGLDVVHPVDQVGQEHLARSINIKSVFEGAISQRPGTAKINPIALDATGFEAALNSETEQGCSTSPVTVFSGAGDGVYGSYITLIASTARISKYWCFTFIFSPGLPDLEHVVSMDISFDAGAGPEVNFIEGHTMNAARRTTSIFSTGDLIQFPFEVPAGSRIRIRVKDTDAGGRAYTFTASMIG